MADRSLPFPDDMAEDLAGCLLTSSTIERYLRCLETSKAVRYLAVGLDIVPQRGVELLKHAWVYWSQILMASARSESEVPLAALMYVLARTGTPDVDSLLIACAISGKLQGTWIASLARKLLATRRGVSTVKMSALSAISYLFVLPRNTIATTQAEQLNGPYLPFLSRNPGGTVGAQQLTQVTRAA